MTTHVLPPFPVDDTTLDLLEAAINPWKTNPDAQRSSLWDFLDMMAALGGSDLTAVSEVIDEGIDGDGAVHVMRDQCYSDHSVILALIDEVRRLREDRSYRNHRPDTVTGG